MAEVGSIEALRADYLQGTAEPLDVLDHALASSNSNAGGNVYLAQDAAWSRHEARRLRREHIAEQPLWGVPVSLKDCFELAGFPTSCGSKFYLETKGLAAEDSAVSARLRSAGAIITGKTHLHQLAYGITGENLDFGDCVQPRDSSRLTGGSSSGAAASVQESSALAAIGTDTGGSIRVPAALCGLIGYRSSITLQKDLWSGGAHLAETFDTLGWLYSDLVDGPLLARVLFNFPVTTAASIASLKIGIPATPFLHDCDGDILNTLQVWSTAFAENGAAVSEFNADFWSDAFPILAGIQAHEAAALHRGNFAHFEPSIAERLEWGASISVDELEHLRRRLASFRERMGELLQRFDYLLVPCSPMSALLAGTDHSQTRVRILRYTSPMSLAGSPVVSLPGKAGGLQLVGRLGSDAELLALSASLTKIATKLNGSATVHP